MKKPLSVLIALLLLSVLCLTGCQKQEQVQTADQTTVAGQSVAGQSATGTQNAVAEKKSEQGKVDYGDSKQFSEADLDAAIKVVRDEIGMWEGVTLKDIRYAGDEASTKENLAWMNELESGKNCTQVCELLTDIEVDKDAPAGAWEAGKTYKDYTWWLARTDGGEWSLMTWGYH